MTERMDTNNSAKFTRGDLVEGALSTQVASKSRGRGRMSKVRDGSCKTLLTRRIESRLGPRGSKEGREAVIPGETPRTSRSRRRTNGDQK